MPTRNITCCLPYSCVKILPDKILLLKKFGKSIEGGRGKNRVAIILRILNFTGNFPVNAVGKQMKCFQ